MRGKAQKAEWRTYLRDSEVDGHLFAKRMDEGFGVDEEGASVEILEPSNSAATG